ncbi:MaoC family dehydratase [Rhodococcus coprophilus]|nr:MaoC family dehydratase [Rhodococcus coprophilus]MBM7460780.1 acyl dehydratase [Rhodococcus coprophilus]
MSDYERRKVKLRTFNSAADFVTAEGEHLGVSGWLQVVQPMVDQFAEVTGDRQWIHTDSVKAANGPFGAPIAHGFLLLSLVPMMLSEIIEIHDMDLMLNSKLREVSFDAAVTVGTFVQLSAELHAVYPRKLLTTAELNLTMAVSDKASLGPQDRVCLRAMQTLIVRSKRSNRTGADIG